MASIAAHSWGASDPNQKAEDSEQLRKEVLENSKEMPQQRSEKSLLEPSNIQYKSAQDLGNTSGAVSPNPSEKAPVTSQNTVDNVIKTTNMAFVTNLHPPNSSDPCILSLPNQNSFFPFPMAPTANHSPQDKSNLLQNPLKDQHLTKFENSSPPPQLSHTPVQNIQTYPHLPEHALYPLTQPYLVSSPPNIPLSHTTYIVELPDDSPTPPTTKAIPPHYESILSNGVQEVLNLKRGRDDYEDFLFTKKRLLQLTDSDYQAIHLNQYGSNNYPFLSEAE
ncbi:hypothetical protein RJT34_04363 [Clitoria ternatea]|uniref:Uncharacterized protein n=1 Tax=Clitoria ternatea TaxID=43366 RepID=A0AAN9Q0I8_CLITE